MSIGNRRHKGFGLASVLIVSLIIATLLTILIGANSSTLSVVRHSEGTLLARSSAESLLSRAVYHLKREREFGSEGESLSFSSENKNDGFADLTFDPVKAAAMGIPVSINNLDNAESVPATDGDVVPARTARLYSVGCFGDERRTVVMDLHIPPYPYAIATEGTFESLGDLTLTGLSPDTSDPVPGDLVTNGTEETSLSLGPRTEISGDLISGGGINVSDEKVDIGGEIRPYSSAKEIPRIDLAQYDPRNLAEPGETTNLNTSFLRDPSFQGKVLREGDLMLSGDINLDGTLVFVDGDLEISGNLIGRGAIVSTGRVTIAGNQTVTTDNELALLVGGDLSIQGSGVDSSKIEGLIYTEGDVEVRNSTIQGTLISQSNGGTTPTVVMERTNVIYDPESTSFSATVESQDLKPTLYLAFGPDGLYDDSLTTADKPDGFLTDTSLPPGDSLGDVRSLSLQPSSSETLYIGATRNADGEYVFFPPDGEPVTAKSSLGAFLQLGNLVFRSNRFLTSQESREAIPQTAMDLASRLAQLQEQIQTAAEVEVQSSTTTSEFELEIDPMRFLKYGDEMRVRAVRIMETKPKLGGAS